MPEEGLERVADGGVFRSRPGRLTRLLSSGGIVTGIHSRIPPWITGLRIGLPVGGARPSESRHAVLVMVDGFHPAWSIGLIECLTCSGFLEFCSFAGCSIQLLTGFRQRLLSNHLRASRSLQPGWIRCWPACAYPRSTLARTPLLAAPTCCSRHKSTRVRYDSALLLFRSGACRVRCPFPDPGARNLAKASDGSSGYGPLPDWVPPSIPTGPFAGQRGVSRLPHPDAGFRIVRTRLEGLIASDLPSATQSEERGSYTGAVIRLPFQFRLMRTVRGEELLNPHSCRFFLFQQERSLSC